MRVNFQKVIIHNFLSFGDAELTLADRGYVLIEGRNDNPEDGALSNGSGKSALFNAVCWALTGETVNGLRTNIPNIHSPGGCFVTLFLKVDGREYEITRYRDHEKFKNDLKIKVDGEDKSGKGLKGSEEVLNQYLPDLTSNLIGNAIILGQGLPHRFSDNTPVGRKESLETLSHSSFMIEEIKTRLGEREATLAAEVRLKEDNQLKLETSLEMLRSQLNSLQTQLRDLPQKNGLLKLLQEKQSSCAQLSQQLEEKEVQKDQLQEEQRNLSLEEGQAKALKLEEQGNIRAQYDFSEETTKRASLTFQIESLEKEIKKLESITDVCPTCGQKIPHVHVPDTSQQKALMEELKAEAASLDKTVETNKKACEQALQKVEIHYQSLGAERSKRLRGVQEEATQVQRDQQQLQILLKEAQAASTQMELELKTLQERGSTLEGDIVRCSQDIEELEQKLLYNKKEIEDSQEHYDAISKISSLVKRDFRGVLLTNVINFIDSKVKDYSALVFNTQDLNLSLSGNSLNIEFCGKAFENLSGGEKQKVDIIFQLAIREMMCQYLDFHSNFLVIDEVFDQLDSTSCSRILNLISQRLSEVESLFIISHHDKDLQIPADSTVVIEKDSRGISRIIR